MECNIGNYVSVCIGIGRAGQTGVVTIVIAYAYTPYMSGQYLDHLTEYSHRFSILWKWKDFALMMGIKVLQAYHPPTDLRTFNALRSKTASPEPSSL